MDEDMFRGIALMLKSIHNAALERIRDRKLDEADAMYRQAGSLAQTVGYQEGIAMSLFCRSNLELLREGFPTALVLAADAARLFGQGEDRDRALRLTDQISRHLLKTGIEREAVGDITGALAHFEAVLPHLQGKRKAAVAYEISYLERKEAHGSDDGCRRTETVQ